MGAVTGAVRDVQVLQGRRPASAQFILREAAGSLGDLGTFIPIVVGMVQIVGLDAGTVLVFAGLANIIAGVTFGIPIAVQPMKAICALAIAGAMSSGQVAVAGLTVAVVVFIMCTSGVISKLYHIIPRPAIRGLQMTVALQLIVGGMRLGILGPGGTAVRPLWGPDALLVFIGGLTLILLLRRRPGWMAACLIGLGLLGACFKAPTLFQTVSLSLWQPRWILTDASGLAGVWLGGLPQIPLTLLNSVFAVSVLAGELFPNRGKEATPAKVALSVALMNFLMCPFGGMPVCHGSGGLAGQHRFGARSGLSMVMLGTAKLAIGFLFGSIALSWMRAFPSSILAVFLVVAAIGLASASRCWDTRQGIFTACVMVAVHFATGVLLLAFVAGWVAYALVSRARNRMLVSDGWAQTTRTEMG